MGASFVMFFAEWILDLVFEIFCDCEGFEMNNIVSVFFFVLLL